MGPDGVVVLAPLLNEDTGFVEAVEDFPVEQLVPQLAVERSLPIMLDYINNRPKAVRSRHGSMRHRFLIVMCVTARGGQFPAQYCKLCSNSTSG